MCRDGFRADCETPGCPNEVTCRDFPRFCHACWEGFYVGEDE